MRKDLKALDDGPPILEAIAAMGSNQDDFKPFNYPGIGRISYALEGAELDEFVTLCIKAALGNGCVPVNERPGEDWLPTYAYGLTNGEIAANMVKAWHALGRDPEYGELMFSWQDWIEPAAYAE